METCVNFHSQLSSIMDILAKAAVAEISKLVEESCCVLRLEISRSQNENERLRKKMQWMESELRAAQRSGVQGSCSVEVYDGLHCTKNDTVSGHETEILPPIQHHQREEDCDMEPVASEGPEGQLANAAGATMKLSAEQSLAFSGKLQEDLQFVIKPERDEGPRPNGTNSDPGRLKSLSAEYGKLERSGQLWTSFIQESSDTENDYPACSQLAPITGRYPHVLSFHTESQPVSTQVEGSCESLSSLSKPWDLMSSTITIKEEVEVCSVGSDKISSDFTHTQGQYGRKLLLSDKNEHLMVNLKQQVHKPTGKQVGVDGSPGRSNMPTEHRDGRIQNDDNSNTVKMKTHKASSGKKWFICTHCGKSLAYFSCYKVHLRSHTGEKPYSCIECGKSFTQQSNLTKHESVHSGKKPFSCSQCGKSFRHRYNLTLHQRIHSGEKPFHCTQCGKSFAQSCHFKRHQLCHEGQKSYKCVN